MMSDLNPSVFTDQNNQTEDEEYDIGVNWNARERCVLKNLLPLLRAIDLREVFYQAIMLTSSVALSENMLLTRPSEALLDAKTAHLRI